MEYLLDILLLGVFALVVLWGYYKGFIHSVLTTIVWIVAVLIAGFLSRSLAEPLYAAVFHDGIVSAVAKQFGDTVDVTLTASNAREIIAQLPESFRALADMLGVDLAELAASIQPGGAQLQSVAEQLTQAVIAPIVIAALQVVLFLLISIVLVIVLRLVVKLLNLVGKLPLIKTANRLLGAVFGVLKGVLLLLVVALVLQLVAVLLPESAFAQAVADSRIINLFTVTGSKLVADM